MQRTQAHATGGEVRKTLHLAAPVMITQLSMMALGAVDTAMVGPLGTAALGAVAVSNSIMMAILMAFGGVLIALDTLVAQSVGAGRQGRAGHLMWQGIWLSLVFGIPLNGLFWDFGWALELFRQPRSVVEAGAIYLSGRSFATVPFFLFAAVRGFLNGLGHTRPTMVIGIVANAVNLVADWLLIHGGLGLPGLGIAGAGIATSLTRWFMLLALLWVAARPEYREYGTRLHLPDGRSLIRIARLGLPIGGQLFAEVGLFSAAGVLAGWLGAVPLAAHQIALTLASLSFMVPLGIGVAATVRVGTEVGRERPENALRAGKVALVMGGGFMALSGLVFVTAPRLLAALFSPEPEALDLAVGLLRIAAAFQIFDGLQAVASGCLRGAGDTRTAFVWNLVAYWVVGLPLAYVFAFGMGLGVRGLWFGLTLSLMVAAVTLGLRFVRGGWRRIGRLVE